jgi:CheY-like chemotaxis protein
MHRGVVEVESAGRGMGSSLTVRIPSIAAPNIAINAQLRTADRPKRKVVLVDDDIDGLLSLRHIVESDGHSVRTAPDGFAGLAAILEWAPDVAVIDIGLPGLNGYEVAKRVRSSGRTTCLVALSGYGQAEDKAKARAAGFDVHLTKPADLEQLMQHVSQASIGVSAPVFRDGQRGQE